MITLYEDEVDWDDKEAQRRAQATSPEDIYACIVSDDVRGAAAEDDLLMLNADILKWHDGLIRLVTGLDMQLSSRKPHGKVDQEEYSHYRNWRSKTLAFKARVGVKLQHVKGLLREKNRVESILPGKIIRMGPKANMDDLLREQIRTNDLLHQLIEVVK